MPAPEPLLPAAQLDALRSALDAFTPDGVTGALGQIGESALRRGDLDGAARCLRDRIDVETAAAQAWLFLLARPLPPDRAATVLAPLDLHDALGAGLLRRTPDGVAATVEIRPYARPGWLVCSDFGSDVRPGPLAADHVLGVGGASLTLAGATPRRPVRTALDLGTGCGVQSLHLGEHAERVVATDISARALRLAATTAALSGQRWELRAGSLLDPVADERFDLIVANPPFVVSAGLSAGAGGHDYRDSGLAGDEVSRRLVRGIPRRLTPGGTAQLLANWAIPSDGDWAARVASWFDDAPVDAWVWQREVLEAQEYVALWLRDAGYLPGSGDYRERYGAWLDWMEAAGIAAVGLGMVTMWRLDTPGTVVCEDVRQAHDVPIGAELDAWQARIRWLATHPDLLAERLRADPDVLCDVTSMRAGGWAPVSTRLRLGTGLRWEIDADEASAALVAAADGSLPAGVLLDLLAAGFGLDPASLRATATPVLADLVARGLLHPAGTEE